MNKNLGKTDRILRVVFGLIIIAVGVVNNSLLGAIGLVPILTALIGWCPAYLPFKLNTTCNKDCKTK